MPAWTSGLDWVPEPSDLHARYSRQHPLDWGENLPTAAQTAAEFGGRATEAALRQLDELGQSVDLATDDLLTAVPPEDSLYQLKHRLKSPQSLARKLAGRLDQDGQVAAVEDLLRYTYLTESSRFVDLTEGVTEALRARGWKLTEVRNSYVERSRSKGLHRDWRTPAGQRVEVQVHPPQSVAVKESTTRLHEIERDRNVPGRNETPLGPSAFDCLRI